MKKFPIVLQEDMKDCGAAALSMIIQFYQGNVPYEELKEELRVSKQGITASNIIRVAEKYGFETKGVEGSFQEFQEEPIILPCIAHVLIGNSYYHYVVIYEINVKKQYLVIGDPAKGLKKMKFHEFESIWNHIILSFYPKVPITYIEPNNILKKQTIEILKKEKKTFTTMIVLSIIITIFSILFSFLLEHFISLLDNHDEKVYLYCSILLYTFFMLLKNGGIFLRNKIFFHVYQKIDFHLMRLVIDQILNLPYRYYKNRTTGEMIARIGDLGMIRTFLANLTLSSFMDFPLFIVSGTVLYFINSKLFLIALITVLLYILLFLYYQKRITANVEVLEEENSKVTSYMVESLGGYETIFGSHLQESSKEEMMKRYFYYIDSTKKLENTQNESQMFDLTLYEFSTLLFLAFGITFVAKQEMSIASLLLFHSLFLYFIEPIRNTLKLGEEYKKVIVSYKRLSNLFKKKEETGIYDTTLKGSIKIKNLKFSYAQKRILKDVSFHIPSGKKVLMVGESGQGKSTILKLLMKYYETPRNSIYLDGIDINDWKEETICKNMLYLSMKEQLFTGTIAQNILLKKTPNYEYNEILSLTETDKIINKTALGHHLVLEENGANLSGGERQRVILARTLLLPFQILLLDEATSQIDIDMERRILKRLFKKYPEKTIIMVTHRLDNLDLFDQKIEIKNGQVIEDVKKYG